MAKKERPTLKHVDNFLQETWKEGRLDAVIEGGPPNTDIRDGLKAQWAADAKQYDELLSNGEGTIPEVNSGGAEPGIYKWVRVYQGSETRKAIGTIYLRYQLEKPDELGEMWLARVRKGLPPNPSDTSLQRINFIPEHVKDFGPEVDRIIEESDREASRFIKDDFGSQGVEGLRATVRVKVESRRNRDHVWVLDDYRVRSTKLAVVLHRFRQAGIQRIPVSSIRKAVSTL